ncbi:hypothetical protein [Frigidibacter sp. MR17.24]|uniref:hypothetical protein n=1 Tax=Frigidibacter sp. MR17.24 TaxID=3127345 RepID=UPI003012EC88
MSAPNTNVERQKSNHVGPLVGMLSVVIFAVAGLIWWLGSESAEALGPTEDPNAAAGAPDASTPNTPPTSAAPLLPETATGQQTPPGVGSN